MPLMYPREMLDIVLRQRNLTFEPDEREVWFSLVDTVFFASLMLEEGETVRVAVVHDEDGAAGLTRVVDASRDQDQPAAAWNVTRIARRPFDAGALAKLSRGLEYGVQLVVVGGRMASDLWIDGVARRQDRTDGGDAIRIAAPRPGVLVFERQLTEVLRFEAGQHVPSTIDVLGEDGAVRSAVGRITGDTSAGDGYSYTELALMRLLRKMRAAGSGAILAMLPVAPDSGVMDKVRYRYVDTMLLMNRIASAKRTWFAHLVARGEHTPGPDTVRALDAKRAEADEARDLLAAAIDDVARLSAIDGAVLTGPGLAVYGAGYLIAARPVGEVVSAGDATMTAMTPYPGLHGARHQAGFSFAWDTPGGVAFVVSEDGPVSCALRVGEQVVVWPVRISET